MTTMSSDTSSPLSQNADTKPSPTTVPSSIGPIKSKPKSRKRVNTAEKRHQHNAIERQRRETLNGKFLSLARLLPSLASHRRPSKSAIVNGSISHLTHQRDQRLLAASELRRLCSERDELFKEVNEWRKANGFPAKDGGSGWTDAMEEIVGVESETFGNFASVGGENGNDDIEEEEEECFPPSQPFQPQAPTAPGRLEMNLDQATAAIAGLTGNAAGVFTPRPSINADLQAMYSQMGLPRPSPIAVPVQQPTLNTWSNDFAFGVNSVPSTASSMPFNAFMTDSIERASTGSPHNIGVVTPTSTSEQMFAPTQTPSPRSSVANDPERWSSAQQMLFLQQQIQQQAMQRQAQQSSLAAQHSQAAAAAGFGALVNNDPYGMLGLFQNTTPQDQIEQWRKMAIAQMQGTTPTLGELKTAVRAGMGMGFGMAGVWQEGVNC
ncbi:hypothetical protein P7C73_g6795, partial [Tremellales sp. Uapishka_1]